MGSKVTCKQFTPSLIMLYLISGCASQTSTPIAMPEITTTPTITISAVPAITFIPTINLTPEPISSEAETYLNEFLDIFLEYTINRGELNPSLVRADAFARASGAQTPADTYDIIRYILENYGNKHSFFLDPQEVIELNSLTIEDFPAPEGRLVEGKIGYIFLGGFGSPDVDQTILYANSIQQILKDLDAQSPCGWIVDLSQETGGDMSPGIVGLGPLIGEGQIGGLLLVDDRKQYWYYRDGTSWVDDFPVLTVSDTGFKLRTPDAPVAVLIGYHTASAGEAIAVAFRGRPNTRFFGHRTAGYTTANGVYEMSDGAELVLTQATFFDRTGHTYGGPIIPDQFAYTAIITDTVTNWLLSQPACKNP